MSDYSRECLVHYDNQHLQVRKDFFCLCAYDKTKYNIRLNDHGNIIRDEPDQECMAKILRILETLTNAEKARWSLEAMNAKSQGLPLLPEPTEYPIMISYEAFYQLMYGTHGDNIIRNSVAVLLERGYIRRTQETINSIPVYTFQFTFIQPLLKNLYEHPKVAVKNNTRKRRVLKITPPISPVGGVENKQVGVENKQQPPKVGVENNTNNIVSPLTNKQGEGESAEQETNSSSSMMIGEGTQVSSNDEKTQQLISSVVSNLGLPSTQTLIETILTCQREYPTLDLVVASKEMRTWFTANHPQGVMTEYWFERNLQKKIEFHKKDTQKAKGVGTSISGKPVIRATEEDKLRVPAPRPRRTPTNASTVFDASKYRQMVACS